MRRTTLLIVLAVLIGIIGFGVRTVLEGRADGDGQVATDDQAGRDEQDARESAEPSSLAATTLDPELERAVELAIAAAAEEGIDLWVTSGLRSVDEQRELWEGGLEEYGSPEEAARWVLPPELSAHVTGLAVDVGPTEGALWLGAHGSRWGLCQVFANEMWHFERLTDDNGTCPEQLPDPSYLLVESPK